MAKIGLGADGIQKEIAGGVHAAADGEDLPKKPIKWLGGQQNALLG